MSRAQVAGPGSGRALLPRLWGAPLWAHALVLLVVLVGLGAVVRSGHAATSDEGAAVAQARLLRDGGWLAPNPVPEIDPDGRFSPYPLADVGTDGRAPFAKHPLYPELLRVADSIGGLRAMVGLSILGTLGAAVAAALLAASLRPGLARPALWVTGLASPLLFDSYLLLGHSLAAATFGFATFVALVRLRSTTASTVRQVLELALVAILLVVTVGLRTEGVFAAIGLGVAALVVAWRGPTAGRRSSVVVAAVVLGAGALAALGERRIRTAIVGSPVTVPGEALTAGNSAWLPGRFESIWNDWFDPGLGAVSRPLALTLVVTTALLAFAAWKARRSTPDVLAVVLLVAAASYGLRLVSSPPVELFGLMVAFPLLWTGLFLIRRVDLDQVPVLLLAVTLVVLSVGIFATNYSVGGSIQWGGRYFALGLPLAVPLALLALRRVVPAPDAVTRPHRLVAVGLVLVCVLTSLLALRVLRHRHDETASLGRVVAAAAAEAGPSGVGATPSRPLVVVGNRLIPQLLYPDLDDDVWLAAGSPASTADALARAGDAGVERLVVVNPPADDSLWPGWRAVSRRSSALGDVAVIERCTAAAC